MHTTKAMRQKVITCITTMEEMFRDYPDTELNWETDFQLLCAVVMSAQTTDKQVNVATNKLFPLMKTPKDMLELWEDWLIACIKTVGLYKWKAKNLMKTASMLHAMSTLPDGSDYIIPQDINEITKLPGVGEKTAKVVLQVLYKQKWVAVDTHVHRVMNRLWIVRTKTPEQTSKRLEKRIPDEYKDSAHRSIIYFWRYLCTARKPQCDRCPLTDLCNYYRNVLSKRSW